MTAVADPFDTIADLQAELSQTNREVLALTLELEKRVEERTIELCGAQEELQRTNSELMQLAIELEDRVAQRTEELAKANDALREEIAERERTVAALRQSEHQLAEAQRIAGIGSWEYDPGTDSSIWSENMYPLFGVSPDTPGVHTAGFFYTRLLHPDDQERVMRIRKAALAGEGPYDIEYRILLPDGAERVIHAQGRLLPGPANRPTRMIGTVQDITAQKRAGEAIRQLNAELEERVTERTAQLATANKELEAFAYSVSHDLRAPLRSINGFSQALSEDCGEALGDQGHAHLRRICAASQRMGQLIDDLLKLSRVARSDVLREIVDLTAMAREIAGHLQSGDPQRQAEFAIEPLCAAHADARLMRILLENLLYNAWKFTGKRAKARIEFGSLSPPSAAPSDTAAGRRRDGGGAERVFFVRDNGAGFDMAYVDKLFGAFQRLHSIAEFPGTGIGLATCQRIVHLHGGRVWAEGELDKGAAIYFALPE